MGFSIDPCQLLCHMEHSLDRCKLVSTNGDKCKNLFWDSEDKQAIIVDTIEDVDLDAVSSAEVVELLKVPRGGCERVCQSHDACVDIGSECKMNDVCLNLFWNRGSPVRTNMTTCYELSEGGCDDGTPILCGKYTRNPEEPVIEGSSVSTPFPNLYDITVKSSFKETLSVLTVLLVFHH